MNGLTAVFTAPGKVDIQEYPIPQVKEEEVLVKIDASAICTWEQRVFTGLKKVEFPFIGGHEMAGHIIDMGVKVNRRLWKIGDKVTIGVMLACGDCYFCKTANMQNCEYFNHSKHLDGLPYRGMGGFSEYLKVPTANLFKYDKVSAAEAAITEPLSCVLHSVETADSQFGDTVVVIGCGIMGLLHVSLSVKKGAVVIVSDINEERLALAVSLGAHYRINPLKEDLQKRVREITGGIGAQVVYDTTPVAEVVEEALKCVGQIGKVVLYSSFYPDIPVSFSPDWLHKGAIKIMGTANSNSRDFERATKLISENVVDVKPFISEIYDFKDIEKAFQSAVQGDKFRVVVKM
jgi:L-iditol 2-dehydrogenase